MTHCELFIVGAGAAGLSAAESAWKNGCRDILLADRNSIPGGILPQCIHEGFGLSLLGRELTGPDFAAFLANNLAGTGVTMRLGTTVLSVSADRTAFLSSANGVEEISFSRMILATGCRERTLGALPVPSSRPGGIYTAGEAQELMNRYHQSIGNRIVIVGSGDLGMILARRFTLEGKTVAAVIEKEAHYGGMARNYRRCLEAYATPLLLSTELRQVLGEGRVSGVLVRHRGSGKVEKIPCDTLVTALGLIPEQSLVKSLGEVDWLSLCGNCRRVHPLVDSAVEEAAAVGRSMAAK